MTNQDISCRDAMLCALHPEQDEFGIQCQELLGVDIPPTIDLKMMPIEDGQAVPCDESGNCEPMPADSCQQSTLHPNCYYKLPTAATFFANPELFLPNYVSDDGDDGDTSGEQGETQDQTAITEDAPSEPESSAINTHRSTCLASIMLLLPCFL